MKKLLYLFTTFLVMFLCLNVYAEDIPITSIKITDVVEPVIGAKVYPIDPTSVFTPAEGASLGEHGWFKAKDSFDATATLNQEYIMSNANPIVDIDNAKYEEGTYILYVAIKLNAGYSVSPSIETKINGKDVSYSTITKEDDNFVELYYVVTLVQKYTITFNANGGSGTMDAVSDVLGDYTLPSCTFTAPKGKKFKGWSLTNNGEVITNLNITGNKTVYAIWENIPVTNPKTADNVVIYTIVGIVSFFGLLYSFIYFKKKRLAN